MLKWWFEKYGASDIILSKRQFTKAAASQGELEVLKWLVENGFKYSADCLAAAAQCGELECIEYLREIGCPWSICGVSNGIVARFQHDSQRYRKA